MKIGIVGYSSACFDVNKAKQILEGELKNLPKDTEIVSGFTNLGIPAIAYDIASKYGYKTVGIACKKAAEYACYPCDVVKLIGINWGDESDEFLTYCDWFIRVGGGKQSFAETYLAKEMGKFVKEFDL